MIRTPLRPLARILRARERGEDPDAIEAETRDGIRVALEEGLRRRGGEPSSADAADLVVDRDLGVEGQEIAIDPDTAPPGRYVLSSRIGPRGFSCLRCSWPQPRSSSCS